MKPINKVFHVDASFEKEIGAEDDAPLYISGYASTIDKDRSNDVVAASVWEEGIKEFLKNPVILGQHNHSEPIGRMEDHRIDKKGLWVKARISKAAEKYYGLIKDGVVTAFSIGFRILDAEYDQKADIFVITKLELTEISAVAVGCNPNTLFSLSKSFDSEDQFSEFKKQFAPDGSSAKGLDSPTEAKGEPTTRKKSMNEDEIKAMVAAASAEAVQKALAEKAAADAEAARKAAEATAAQKSIDDAVAARVAEAVKSLNITTGESGVEKLMADVEKRFADADAASAKSIADLQAVLNEKSAEILAMQKSKMKFNAPGDDLYKEKETAYLLAKMAGKKIEDTKYGQSVIEKAGPHVPSATWELEVSRNMEAEIRRRLVVAPTLRNIQMETNVMTMPVNPEAGAATWVTNAQFGTTNSMGAAQTHQLKEITLNAYKVATAEYMNYEEQEDSLLILLPVVRDAMVRRVARAVDKAFLLGAGSGADPVKGLAAYDTTSAVVGAVATKVTVANMIQLRRDLGTWGLDPSELIYFVNNDVYYDLLEDTTFQTNDKVGDRATLLTGQIGSIGNTPVIVSGSLPSKVAGAAGALTNVGAICFHPGNFIVGNQRGLRFDTQDLVETQRKVMVASLRTGMTQVSTNEGIAISAFRYTT